MTKVEQTITPPWITGLLLAATTILVYLPVASHDFVTLDDPNFVTANAHVQQGLTWKSIAWAFRPGHGDYWHPLAWMSHMLDVELFGKSAAGPHMVNVLLHAANALLLFLMLRLLTGAHWRSAFVAALFALHPFRVESVAWISERKDVLSLFFALIALWFYARYAQEKNKDQSPSFKAQAPRPSHQASPLLFYWLVMLFFTLGLMSKAMLVTLPFVMLLLDYWPLKRMSGVLIRGSRSGLLRLVWEKVPFFALSASACLLTFLTGKKAIGAIEGLSFGVRLETAVMGYLWYVGKAVWPVNLAPMYPYPDGWPSWSVVTAGVVLIGLSLAALLLARRCPYFLTGWFWYLGTLLPVIGLVQVGIQWVADRFTYLPLTGLFMVIAWAGAEIFKHRRLPRLATFLIVGLVLAAFALRTRDQLKHWKDSQSLFAHAVDVTRNNYFAYNMLGCALMAKGDQELAKAHFMEALRIRPRYTYPLAKAYPHANLGDLFAQQGHIAEARSHYETAIEIDPTFTEIHAHLAQILTSQGDLENGIAHYREALRLKPDFIEALNNLAWILATCPDAKFRSGSEAVQLAEHACELSGYQAAYLIGTLAAAYAEAGRFEQAVATAERARALAETTGQVELANRNSRLLEMYRVGKAYREESAAVNTESRPRLEPMNHGTSRDSAIK